MKKFLKVFIIVILVVASVGGTCFFFFRNLKEKNNTTESISAILYAESSEKFHSDLYTMTTLVNSDGTDPRINLVIETNTKLDEIVEILTSYYVETDTKINNEKISKSLDEVKSARSLLNSMMREYNIKQTSIYFDRHVGANDFYEASCNYLISYAKFANYLNTNLDINKNGDIRFNTFEIYANVVINSFSKTRTMGSKTIIEDSSSIDTLNDAIVILNSFVVTSVDRFAKEINEFNDVYYNCNKTDFAVNFAENVKLVNNANQDTNEKLATYYFKQIFGI